MAEFIEGCHETTF